MSGCQSCKPGACPSKPASPPPSVRDMVKIAWGLTVVCLISALLLGALYSFTEPVKLRNAAEREARVLRTLLELPDGGRIEEVRRYLTEDLRAVYLTSKFLVSLDSEGKENQRTPFPAELAQAKEEHKDAWVMSQVPSRYVGRFFVGKNGENTAGFVIEGATTGYKARIRFFVALDPELTVRGVEILEQEEDPGLGGEIVKRFFKNQFAGRTVTEMETLAVSKDPMNAEWRAVVESLGPKPYSAWIKDNQGEIKKHPVIYAITGSTISSEAVTSGVRKTIGNFRKRLELLKGAL